VIVSITLAHGCDGKHTVSHKSTTHTRECLSVATHAMGRRAKQRRRGNTEDAITNIGWTSPEQRVRSLHRMVPLPAAQTPAESLMRLRRLLTVKPVSFLSYPCFSILLFQLNRTILLYVCQVGAIIHYALVLHVRDDEGVMNYCPYRVISLA